mgnify:CR=1 FL=1
MPLGASWVRLQRLLVVSPGPAGGVGVRVLLMGALLGASWALLGSLSGSLGTLLGFSKAVLRLPGPSRSSLERLVGRL